MPSTIRRTSGAQAGQLLNRRTNESDVDPLDIFTLPPPNETPSDRAARERREQEALQRSHDIDAELKAAKASMKRYKKAIKVLVLGQSFSDFQITYANKSWLEERQSWKAVILLNLVRSVNIMADILETHSKTQGSSRTLTTETHRSILFRLAPLRQIEKDLKLFLGSGSNEIEVADKYRTDDLQSSLQLELNKPLDQEFCLHSSSGWKGILAQIRSPQSGKGSDLHRVAWHVVRGCKEDIQWLWTDSVTQRILRDRNVRLEDSSGFFLEDVDRVTDPDYEPSDQDVLCARLRTTGVQEYHFILDRANGTILDWVMYDVAGIRTSRAAWIPYFKDMTAIIFLAPLSGFNERLEEDDRINRLEDTFALWKTISSSKLLINVQIILFMNKIDILRKKLEHDKIQVKRYIPDYDKPNDFENVATYFRRAFKKIYVQTTPPDSQRSFIAHLTSVIDSMATAQTLYAVQTTILRNDLSEAGLI
ncbi:G-alpha-domain-containing protein [Pholiota conissans]|uniref:G-alpha-domain-containing protein n=1 Tax=Pholiota conissans TaxID=109636 RepID=A0A9P5YYL0_9AGAR|nr:G-alpha-domain-containing protein [Pholiota conissans]